ncbi:MAG: 4a-hydroxytetrahydrobiopterin dehydratase [Gemmatimonadaceae bacterium]
MKERALDDAEIRGRLADLPGWTHAGNAIERRYATEGWPATLMLVNAIGYLCEAADHHPDLQVSWGGVTVRFNTHTAGGVSEKDIEIARKVDEVALWRPRGGALAGTTRKWVAGA